MEWWQKLIFVIFAVCLAIAVFFSVIFGIGKFIQPKVVEVVREVSAIPESVPSVEIEKVEGVIPGPYESEGGLPPSVTTWSFDVAPNEIEVLTGGPASISGVDLPGGANPDRGSVIIMLPADKVIPYKVTNLVPGANWHGAYDFGRKPTEEDWIKLAEDRILAMQSPPNGTSGEGCTIVDVVVVKGDQIVKQWIVEK